jgi:TM2 domain-containing membrane protein YozV
LDRVPSRFWFPIGFVGFFFITGGWNQLSSSWLKVTGAPLPGSAHSLGLLFASLIFLFCLFFGYRGWWRERAEKQKKEREAQSWQADLRKHNDDIRFP